MTGTRKARLIRVGILLAVDDWVEGERTNLRAAHPYTVKAYARAMARMRVDQLGGSRSRRRAFLADWWNKVSDAQTLAQLDQELDQRNGL